MPYTKTLSSFDSNASMFNYARGSVGMSFSQERHSAVLTLDFVDRWEQWEQRTRRGEDGPWRLSVSEPR